MQSAGAEAAKADKELLFFNRPKEFVSKAVQDRVGAIVTALKDSTRVSNSEVLDLANKPPASGEKFTAVLDRFRAGQPSFTNAAFARVALTAAVIAMDRSDAFLSAWEQRLGLTQPKS